MNTGNLHQTATRCAAISQASWLGESSLGWEWVRPWLLALLLPGTVVAQGQPSPEFDRAYSNLCSTLSQSVKTDLSRTRSDCALVVYEQACNSKKGEIWNACSSNPAGNALLMCVDSKREQLRLFLKSKTCMITPT